LRALPPIPAIGDNLLLPKVRCYCAEGIVRAAIRASGPGYKTCFERVV
jgi:hypothetical protein